MYSVNVNFYYICAHKIFYEIKSLELKIYLLLVNLEVGVPEYIT